MLKCWHQAPTQERNEGAEGASECDKNGSAPCDNDALEHDAPLSRRPKKKQRQTDAAKRWRSKGRCRQSAAPSRDMDLVGEQAAPFGWRMAELGLASLRVGG